MDLWISMTKSRLSSDPLETVETILCSDDRFKCERAEDGDVHFSFKVLDR